MIIGIVAAILLIVALIVGWFCCKSTCFPCFVQSEDDHDPGAFASEYKAFWDTEGERVPFPGGDGGNSNGNSAVAMDEFGDTGNALYRPIYGTEEDNATLVNAVALSGIGSLKTSDSYNGVAANDGLYESYDTAAASRLSEAGGNDESIMAHKSVRDNDELDLNDLPEGEGCGGGAAEDEDALGDFSGAAGAAEDEDDALGDFSSTTLRGGAPSGNAGAGASIAAATSALFDTAQCDIHL